MKTFVTEDELYEDNPIETINTNLFTLVFKEFEPKFFLWMIIAHENLYTDENNEDSNEYSGITISNYDPVASLFREEDSTIFTEALRLYYNLFTLFHDSIKSLFDKDIHILRSILNDFTQNFLKHFFTTDWCSSFFGNSMFRGYRICPIDPKTYLYAQKCINNLCQEFPVSKVAVFFEEFFVYSDLPQDQVEVLHTYFFGTNYHRREGYKPNWTDAGQKGEMLRVKVDGHLGEPQENEQAKSEREQLAAELGFEDVDYEDVLNQNYSTFCKVNVNGFKGSKFDKWGYLIGPTLLPVTNEDDENKIEFYEMFWPKVYLRDKAIGNTRNPYRMIVVRFDEMSFILLIDEANFKLPERKFRQLYDLIQEKAKNMIYKLGPIVEYNDENPLEQEEHVKFYYFNQSNLAIKMTPKFSRKLMTNEIRHLMNLIKTKFDDNPCMTEYQITSTDYWVIGKRSLPRVLIIILSPTLTQAEAENEANEISSKYFPHL